MRTINGRRTTLLRRLADSAGDESGVLMMFVLMAVLLIAVVTLTVIQLISADVAGGLRELQAEQVFNIAQAGVHYGIGKLQAAGANSHAGETKTITSESTTLGTATITVNCIDTGAAPPCAGNYAGDRRNGAVYPKWVAFNTGVTFTADTSGLPTASFSAYTNFNYLRSWKDQ